MAFSQTETNFRVEKRVEGCQVEVKDVNLSSVNSAKQILGYVITPKITNVEEVGLSVNFSGTACVSVMAMSESGEVFGTRENIDFNSSFEKTNLSNIWLYPTICDSNVKINDSETLVSFSVKVDYFGHEDILLAQLNESDENVVTKTEEKQVYNLSSSSNEEFNLTEDFKVSRVVESVVLTDANIVSSEVMSGDNVVTISGTLNVKLVYKTGEELSSEVREIPFKQEVSCIGATGEDNSNVSLYLSNISATISSETNENETTISIIASVVCNCFCYQEKMVTEVVDAFSTTCETNSVLTADCVNACFVEPVKNQYADGIINIEGYPEFDEVVNACAIQTYVSNENDAVVSTIIIMKDREGNLTSTTENVPVVASHLTKNARAIAINFHNRGGKELEVNYVFADEGYKTQETCLNYVSNLEEVSEINDESDMKMYVVRENETLFDVCRALKVTPEVVASQNENTDSLKKGDKVFVYFPKTANFEE